MNVDHSRGGAGLGVVVEGVVAVLNGAVAVSRAQGHVQWLVRSENKRAHFSEGIETCESSGHLRSFLGDARCLEADVGLRYEGVWLPPALPGKRPGRQLAGLTGVLNLAGGLELDSGVFLGSVAVMYRLGVLAYLLLRVGVFPGVVKYFLWVSTAFGVGMRVLAEAVIGDSKYLGDVLGLGTDVLDGVFVVRSELFAPRSSEAATGSGARARARSSLSIWRALADWTSLGEKSLSWSLLPTPRWVSRSC